MTQNTSNNEELQATIAGLKDALEKAELKVVMHEAVWKTSQKLLTERNEEINCLEQQVQLYKQEFADASKSNLEMLEVLEKTKIALDDMVKSLNN